MKDIVSPFSTLGPGEAALRVGLGSLACASILQEATPQERKLHHLLIDAAAELAAPCKGVEDINFWPVAIARLYRKSDSIGSEDELALNQDWLYRDTVVFNLKDNLPQESSTDSIKEGRHVLQQVLLAFVQNNKTHWFSCGGSMDPFDPKELFLDYGNVGMASAKGLVEQYEAIEQNLPPLEELSKDEQPYGKFIRWMIANALIANLAFTGISMQA